jgi:hypothetical protein
LQTANSDAQRIAARKQARKKAQPLPAGPWKFWERMPERQVLYDLRQLFVQVRINQSLLQKMQQLFSPTKGRPNALIHSATAG